MGTDKVSTTRPRSAVSQLTGIVGLAGLAASLAIITVCDFPFDTAAIALIVLIAVALPMVLLELLVFRRKRQNKTSKQPRDQGRIAIKLLGLYATCAVIAFLYWLFPEYRGKLYNYYFHYLLLFLPGLIIAAIPYVWWFDGRMSNPFDGAWHAGMAVLCRWGEVNREVLEQFFRGWLIKGFFLPLMFAYTVGHISTISHGIDAGWMTNPRYWYGSVFTFEYLIDVVFACIGYCFAFRLFGTHIRSSEPTMLGWVVALVCYYPFSNVIMGQYLRYNPEGLNWGTWLWGTGALFNIWPAAIVLLLIFYCWATMSFGLRFSNLTHRGIITNGPYRFSKHPAYISKNISWWLISAPFLTQGPWYYAVRNCALILIVNVIYYFRARTEERHLAQDPVYIQYALWIEQHGWLRKAGQWFPRAFAFRWREQGMARDAMGLEQKSDTYTEAQFGL